MLPHLNTLAKKKCGLFCISSRLSIWDVSEDWSCRMSFLLADLFSVGWEIGRCTWRLRNTSATQLRKNVLKCKNYFLNDKCVNWQTNSTWAQTLKYFKGSASAAPEAFGFHKGLTFTRTRWRQASEYFVTGRVRTYAVRLKIKAIIGRLDLSSVDQPRTLLSSRVVDIEQS